MDRVFYVYQLRVECEELPFYVGKGKNNRAYEHLRPSALNYDPNKHKTNKIRKAQREGNNVLVEFLRERINEHQANRLEKYWIAKIGRADLGLGPLTNATNGGEGMSGWIPSDETRNKISNTKKSNPVVSTGFSGRRHTEESKKRTSSKLNGRKYSAEHVAKVAAAHRGLKRRVLECPHCGKTGGANMKRYHFDNCKRLGNS